MKLRICVFLCSVHLLALHVSYTSTDETPDKVLPNPPATSKDDIYIDDERIEGSGNSETPGKDDLESSGSGFGPDDEDGDGGLRNMKPGKGNTKTRVLDVEDNDVVTPVAPPKTKVEDNSGSQSSGTKVKSSEDHEDHSPDQTLTELTVNRDDFVDNSKVPDHSSPGSGGGINQDVFVVGGSDDRTTSFFAQPGILAAVIGGAVVGLLCAILVVMFIVYRMRKKDEGSYALEEPKRSPASNSYMKNSNREFYA